MVIRRLIGRVGRVLLALFLAGNTTGWASTDVVGSTEELVNALNGAAAGDVIELLPGDYRVPRRVTLDQSGGEGAPIIVRSSVPGSAVVRTELTTLFKVTGSHWRFEGIDFQGSDHANHGLHIARDADFVVVERSRFQNFHTAIKGNGEGEPRQFPDHVHIVRNVFVNDEPRNTDQPVVAIDVVGGQGWHIAQNFIADISNERHGRHGSAGFVKGGAQEAVFDSNLVVCEWRHSGNRRIGLSLGGGSTGGAYFDRRGMDDCGEDCPEVRDSRVTNNVILNCPDEPGIYLNKAENSVVANNTIYGAFGIQARFPQTDVEIRDNLLTGTIWERDGGTVRGENNVETGWFDWSNYIPGLKHHLTYRISDYHVLLPNWISESSVRWTQDVIRSTADWLAAGLLGQRRGPFRNWFLSPDGGNFRLVDDAGDIVRQGSSSPVVESDFCGQARSGTADVGAIQYSAGECHLAEELIRRHGVLFTELQQ